MWSLSTPLDPLILAVPGDRRGTAQGTTVLFLHDEQVFDTRWPEGEPLNTVTPDRVPTGATRPCPVIARLVWPDREEGWPAKAVRWTSTAVLVSIQIVPDDPMATRYMWLAADDVKRKITAPRQDEAHSDSAAPASD